MSDWAVGDLAVCVREKWDDDPRPAPANGEFCRVAAVGIFEGLTGLALDGYITPLEQFFNSAWFRKILPDKHEACETEFVTLLQRIKRKQVA